MSKLTDRLAGTTLGLHPHGAPQIDASAIATVTFNADASQRLTRPALTIEQAHARLEGAMRARVRLAYRREVWKAEVSSYLTYDSDHWASALASLRDVAMWALAHQTKVSVDATALQALVADLEGR